MESFLSFLGEVGANSPWSGLLPVTQAEIRGSPGALLWAAISSPQKSTLALVSKYSSAWLGLRSHALPTAGVATQGAENDVHSFGCPVGISGASAGLGTMQSQQ